jgi:DNA-binding transcriptional MerR regulator
VRGTLSSVPDESPLTIDELARRTGMTVRNLRAHQSRGLLPAPEVRGRTGYYGPEHIARIELIKELQADGFNLEAIRRLIENAGGSTSEVLRFTRAARETFEEEPPQIVTVEELAERWGEGGGAQLLQRAIGLGLLRPLGDGRLEERSPRLARAGAQLARLGVPVERSLDTLEALRRHADGVAHAYVALFFDEVWRPFDEAGRPPERWPAVMEALERLRPLATESLLAMFGLVMTDAVDEAVGAQLTLGSTRAPDEGS